MLACVILTVIPPTQLRHKRYDLVFYLVLLRRGQGLDRREHTKVFVQVLRQRNADVVSRIFVPDVVL